MISQIEMVSTPTKQDLVRRIVVTACALVVLSAGAPEWLNVSFPNAGPFVVLILILTLLTKQVIKSAGWLSDKAAADA
jgi:uncharacterized membrane protein YdbT with pleckstrin-like domain